MLSILHEMNIRTGSVVWAIQDVNEFYSNRTQAQYEEYMLKLTGTSVESTDALTAEITFKYIVQGIIRCITKEEKINILSIIADAKSNAIKLVRENGPTMRLLRSTVAVINKINDSSVNPTFRKTGVLKRDQANGFIEQNKLLAKPLILKLLAAELAISMANANTYYSKWAKQQVKQ